MKAREFFEKVEDSLRSTKGDDPIGVSYFIQDMEELFEEWEEEDNQ